MTTEIAVMNKNAISLAADSAVTVGRGHKFYNTANKLFMLSKFQPVGIMVYNNAEFMGYPVETIIKEYRKKLRYDYFNTLEEYWEDFLKYLKEHFSYNNGMEDLISKITAFIYSLDKNIKKQTENEIEKYIIKTKDGTDTLEQKQEKMKEIASKCIPKVISNIYEEYCSYEDDNSYSDRFEQIKENIKEPVYEITNRIIGGLDDDDSQNILNMCVMVLTKKHSDGPRTGVVIAGFGEEDMFPKLVDSNLMGVYFETLKYDDERITKIDNENEAIIKPFAQDDVISTFMTGIDQALKLGIFETIDKYKLFKCKDKNCIEELKKEIGSKIHDWSKKNHIHPIMETVSIAPKEELAQMAETLVNLTSFRRKLSMDVFSHSVGGPIDVALITKGDGFIWMKKKHYFDMNINQHFMQNYFKRR